MQDQYSILMTKFTKRLKNAQGEDNGDIPFVYTLDIELIKCTLLFNIQLCFEFSTQKEEACTNYNSKGKRMRRKNKRN